MSGRGKEAKIARSMRKAAKWSAKTKAIELGLIEPKTDAQRFWTTKPIVNSPFITTKSSALKMAYENTCTRKKPYLDEVSAQRAVSGASKTMKQPMKSYLCPVCNKYHLTHIKSGIRNA